MAVINLKNRVLVYPNKGKLLVCSDLHGNKRDYLKVMKGFTERRDSGEDVYLLFLGDLVHGPQESRQINRGEIYVDDSEFVLRHFMAMGDHYGGNVSCLLGNHEHGHVGGPHTSKYCSDEVLSLESKFPPEERDKVLQWMSGLPLIAITQTGVILSHGATAPSITSIEDVLNVSYEGHSEKDVNDMFYVAILELLWRRGASKKETEGYLKAVRMGHQKNKIAVFGHEIIEEGYCSDEINQFVFSSSFGVKDEKKVCLELDLARHYSFASDFREGIEILRLWPDLQENEAFRYQFARKSIEKGHYNEAIFSLTETEDCPQRNFLLGSAYYYKFKQGDQEALSQAESYFRKTLAEDYSNAEAHFRLGELLEAKADVIVEESRSSRLDSLRYYSQSITYDPRYQETATKSIERVRARLKD